VDQAKTWKTPHGFQNTDASGKTAGGGGEFAKQVVAWQTPATDSFRSRGGERKDEQGLDQQARLWRTPDSPGAGGPRNRKKSIGHGHQTTIAEQVDQWPTPNVPNGGRSSNNTNYRKNGSKQQRQLEAVARDVLIRCETDQWPSPQASDTRSGVTGDIKKKNSRPLREAVSQFSLPVRRTSKHGLGCSCNPRMLNQRFVEMLMNVPTGWTDAGRPLEQAAYGRWAMASSRFVSRMRTSRCETPLTLTA